MTGRCDWFQSRAAWVHLDNKMAHSLATHTYRCKHCVPTHTYTHRQAQNGGEDVLFGRSGAETLKVSNGYKQSSTEY